MTMAFWGVGSVRGTLGLSSRAETIRSTMVLQNTT